MTNKQYSETKSFVKDCSRFDIKPTSRQASKYRRNMGRLFKMANGIKIDDPKRVGVK